VAGAEPVGQMKNEKLHAIVTRSIFLNQIEQNTSFSDHFWKLRYRKNTHRDNAKYISKLKYTKYLNLGPLLEVKI